MTGPGDFATLNAGDGSSKNWFEQAAGRGSQLVGAGQDLADASSPPEWGVAAMSLRAEQLQAALSPFDALKDNGLGFLISLVMSPFVELLEMAIGDPEQMRSTGEGWEKVADWLHDVSEQEKQRGESTAQSWVGKDGDAFRRQMAEFSQGVEALSQDIRGLKETLDGIAEVFDLIVEFFVQVFTELVIGLIIQWVAALAASWVTAGGSVAAAGATTTVQVGATGVRVATRVTKLQAELFRAFQQIERLLQSIRKSGKLGKVIDGMDNLRNGGFMKRSLAAKVDRHTPLKFLTKANSEDMTSQGFTRFVKDATESEWYQNAKRDLDDQIARAAGGPNGAAADALKAERDQLRSDVKGVQGLVNNVVSHGLQGPLGGQFSFDRAAKSVGMDMATDAAVEEGAKSIYDNGRGAFQGDLSEDERGSAQERGFQ